MKLKDFLTLKVGAGVLVSGTRYNPLINYDWSTTTTSGLRYLKDVGSTPAYNASMYFGRGAYLNGVDQGITNIPYTLQSKKISLLLNVVTVSAGSNQYIYDLGLNPLIWRSSNLIRVYINGVNHNVYNIGAATSLGNIAITVDEGILKFYLNGTPTYTAPCGQIANSGTARFAYGGASSAYAKMTIKDAYAFNKVLTQAEITQAYEQPEVFYIMAKADSTCVLNMPMCETSSTVRNYKTGIDYPIKNYTSSVRDNAKNLQYGLQTCKFVRDSLGVIQSASDYLECDGVGYIKTQWVPNGTDVFTLETVITPALVSKLQAHGNYGTSINEIQIGVTASNLVFASSLNSETVYLPYTENMHVCIVSDGVQSYYYCNNVLIKTTYNNSGSTLNPFAFGGVNSGTIFNPTYDTLRLFKIHAIAYTSSQVDAAYYALSKKNTIAYDVIPDECLYDENGNVYIDERGNYIGVDGYVMDESGEYYIV